MLYVMHEIASPASSLPSYPVQLRPHGLCAHGRPEYSAESATKVCHPASRQASKVSHSAHYYVTCCSAQVKRLYKLFNEVIDYSDTGTVAHHIIAAETCCTACSLPFAADSVYHVESQTCTLDCKVLNTLAALLPENDPVVSMYVTCSPLIAAATAAIMHNCRRSVR